MPRPCQQNHLPSPQTCRLCYLAETDPAYRALWADPPPGPCRHLGADSGAVVECPTCNGRVRLRLFACAVHGHCTTGKPVAPVACCAGCKDYKEGA